MIKANLSNIRNKMDFKHGIYGEKLIRKSAVLALIIEVNGKLHFVFQERHKNIRQGGEVSFPGGSFEKGVDSSLLDTSIRETIEEMGIKRESIEILGQLDTLIAPSKMMVEVFVGFSTSRLSDFSPNPDEVSKVFTVPVEHFFNNEPEYYEIMLRSSPVIIDPETNEKKTIFPAKELGLPEMYYDVWDNNIRTVPLFKTKDGIIWGFTAQIILNFIEKMLAL